MDASDVMFGLILCTGMILWFDTWGDFFVMAVKTVDNPNYDANEIKLKPIMIIIFILLGFLVGEIQNYLRMTLHRYFIENTSKRTEEMDSIRMNINISNNNNGNDEIVEVIVETSNSLPQGRVHIV